MASVHKITELGLEIAEKYKVDLNKVVGSGENGLVTYNDLMTYLKPKRFKYYNDLKKSRHRVKLEKIEELKSETKNKEIEPQKFAEKSEIKLENEKEEKLKDVEIKNDKAKMPHFWQKMNFDLTKVEDLITKFPEEKKIDLEKVIIKLVHDSILENPDFLNFRINGKFLKANNYCISYENLADKSLNKIYSLNKISKLGEKNALENNLNNFMIRIIDGSQSDLTYFMPVLSEKVVLLKECYFDFGEKTKNAGNY